MASTSISHASHNAMPRRRIAVYPLCRFALCLIALTVAVSILPRHSYAQNPDQESAEEIVANLCAGRVVIGVAKDGIVVATAENPIEPETRPPMIVPLSDERVAILFRAPPIGGYPANTANSRASITNCHSCRRPRVSAGPQRGRNCRRGGR